MSSSGNLINVARPYGYRKSAFGVIGMSYPTGPIREVLKAGASTEKCLARSQSCPRYRRPAAAINDAPEGAKAMNRSAPKHVTLNNCVEHFLETRIDQDAQVPQVKARYWQLIALQIASARRTLGRKIFKEAVWMAGGLPLSMPMLNIGAHLKSSIGLRPAIFRIRGSRSSSSNGLTLCVSHKTPRQQQYLLRRCPSQLFSPTILAYFPAL